MDTAGDIAPGTEGNAAAGPIQGLGDRVLVQVCLVVDDADRYAQRTCELFGLAMPEPHLTDGFSETEATYYGDATEARARIFYWQFGNVGYEILQPLGPGSVWQDWLDEHGPSVHHVAFRVTDSHGVAREFARHGFPVSQQGFYTGRLPDGGHTGMYTYLDTVAALGTTFELLESFAPDSRPPGSDRPAAAGSVLPPDALCQVGFVVRDVEATARRYAEAFGFPVPPIIETPGFAQAETTLHGEPSEATAKLAFFQTGQVVVELIEPDARPSVWRDHLEAKGEGVHHIAFRVADTGATEASLAAEGIPTIQQGLFADRSGMYTYVDSASQLGVMVELLESFPKARA